MAAFNFPDPTIQQTVTNPITGSTYQWKEPPGKWVITTKVRAVSDIIYEGDTPPIPRGDYKLWYSTDTLELYFWYEDENGVGAWVPTSVPITAIEELAAFAAEAEVDIDQLQYKQQLLQNAVDQLYLEAQTGAGNRPPIFGPTEPDKHPDYTPPEDELIAGDIWYDNTDPDNLEQHIYDGSQWVVYGGQFVHRQGGDTMEGPLNVTGGRNADADGLESTVKTLNVDSGQNSSLNLKWNGSTKVYVGDDQTSFQGDIKFNQGGRAIYAGNDKKAFVINDGGVFYDGAYTADRHVATKKNVEEAIFDNILDDTTNKFVKRSGDSMDGQLEITDGKGIKFTGLRNSNKAIELSRNTAEYPALLTLNHPGGSTLGGYDIKLNGNTTYNELRIMGGSNANTPSVVVKANGFTTIYKNLNLDNNKIIKLGPATDDTDAVTYGQVKEELTEFRDNLVQELTFGSWLYASDNVSPLTGRFYFRDALNATNNLAPNTVTQMVFNETDFGGAVGAFDRVDTGELISLTNGSVTVKYRVNSPATTSGATNEVRSFYVQFISQSTPTFFVDGVPWTFTLTEFTDISVDQLDDTYLRLDCSNDPLETELEIKTPDFGEAAITLHGKRDNTKNSSATVAFKNQLDTAEAYAGYLTYRTDGSSAGFFKFNQDVDLNNKVLRQIGEIRMTPGGYIGSGKING